MEKPETTGSKAIVQNGPTPPVAEVSLRIRLWRNGAIVEELQISVPTTKRIVMDGDFWEVIA